MLVSIIYFIYGLLNVIISDSQITIEWQDDNWMVNWKICDLSWHLPGETWENHKKFVKMVSVPFTTQTVYFLITSVAEVKNLKCIILFKL